MTGKALMVACALWATTGWVGAAEVDIHRTDSRDAVLEGTRQGISVDPLGAIELAREVSRLAKPEEPFVFTAAAHPQGWVLGTGNDGKVILATPDGGQQELYKAEEAEIFAVLAEDKKDGAVWAGSSPKGKVYRIQGGQTDVLFDPPATYIWDLAQDNRGRLLVATGQPGRVYRLGDGGKEEVIYESPDGHVRSLQPLADGGLLVGTAGQGLILRIHKDGRVTTVLDAAHPEVLTFTQTDGGETYAALLASEASQVDLSSSGSEEKKGDSESGGVTVSEGNGTIGSRGGGFSGARSVIIKISDDGTVENVAEFEDETAHALLWHRGELWIGTGQEGRLYRHSKQGLIEERVVEEQQIIALVAGEQGAAMVTTNGSAVYQFGGGPVQQGTFTSAVVDADEVARFGSFSWVGDLPKGSRAAVSIRTGMSAAPDATWTPWRKVECTKETPCRDTADQGAARRYEIPLGELSGGRYAQWRVTLEGRDGNSPRLEVAELSYRQDNQAPKVSSLEVLDPGEVLVPSSFNAQNQTFEPWSPNREGIFTTLRVAAKSDDRLKTLWKKGYRTLRWKAEDANEDDLQYHLEVRSENGKRWFPMARELDQNHYSFDATVLPDGMYRFRVTASDHSSRATGEALQAEKISPPVVNDHNPPRVLSTSRGKGYIEVVVDDGLNPLRQAVYSLDAGDWQSVPPVDGVLDSRREVLRIPLPQNSPGMALLRLTDAAWNVTTVDLLAAAPE